MMNSRFALLPAEFSSDADARECLSEVVPLSQDEPLSFLDVPTFSLRMVYAGEERPEVYNLLMLTMHIGEHNKIAASYKDGELSLVIAQGTELLLCNSYSCSDFSTAEYYIFLSMSNLQMNLLSSVIYFHGELPQDEYLSLCSYFKSVEYLK